MWSFELFKIVLEQLPIYFSVATKFQKRLRGVKNNTKQHPASPTIATQEGP